MDKTVFTPESKDLKNPPVTIRVDASDWFPTQEDYRRGLSTYRYTDVYKRFLDFPFAFKREDQVTAAANTAVIWTAPLLSDQVHAISSLTWSFDGATTTALLQVSDNGDIVWEMNVGRNGAGWDYFVFVEPRMQRNPNTPFTVTLTAAGVGVIGRLNVNQWRF
jgi:hypothetical protein